MTRLIDWWEQQRRNRQMFQRGTEVERAHLRGRFSLVLKDASGKVLRKDEHFNLIVDAGAAVAASRLGGLTADPFTYLALGIDATAPATGDTALGSEITTGGGARAAATVSRVTTDSLNDTLQLVHTFTFTATFAIVELGVFNDPAAGTMLCRATASPYNVVSTNTLAVTYKVDVD